MTTRAGCWWTARTEGLARPGAVRYSPDMQLFTANQWIWLTLNFTCALAQAIMTWRAYQRLGISNRIIDWMKDRIVELRRIEFETKKTVVMPRPTTERKHLHNGIYSPRRPGT